MLYVINNHLIIFEYKFSEIKRLYDNSVEKELKKYSELFRRLLRLVLSETHSRVPPPIDYYSLIKEFNSISKTFLY